MAFGSRVWGLGVMALAGVCLAWGDFDPGQPVPKTVPDRAVLAYGVAAFMLVAGAAVQWRRCAAWAAAALTAYYALIVVVLMNGALLPAHYAEFGLYSGAAEQLAIAAAGLIVYAAAPGSMPPWPRASRAWASWRSRLVRCCSAERIFST